MSRPGKRGWTCPNTHERYKYIAQGSGCNFAMTRYRYLHGTSRTTIRGSEKGLTLQQKVPCSISSIVCISFILVNNSVPSDPCLTRRSFYCGECAVVVIYRYQFAPASNARKIFWSWWRDICKEISIMINAPLLMRTCRIFLQLYQTLYFMSVHVMIAWLVGSFCP